MMNFRTIAVLPLIGILISCGGGGGDSPTTVIPVSGTSTPTSSSGGTGSPGGGTSTGTSSGSASTSGNSSSGGATSTPPTSDGGSTGSTTGGGGTSTPPAPATGSGTTAFAAAATDAPADGATISGTVRINLAGSGIQNVELLPGTGYAPLYTRGTVSGDGVSAFVDFNTALLPDGPITLRIAAFNQPPGSGGSEITAMSSRSWTIRNTATPTFAATLVSAPQANALLGLDNCCGPNTADLAVSGSGMRNVELVSANNEAIIYGRFAVNAEGTLATLSWGFYLNSYGSYDVKIVAWDVPPGQAGRKIEVMPSRHYYVHLPLGCYSNPLCGIPAP